MVLSCGRLMDSQCPRIYHFPRSEKAEVVLITTAVLAQIQDTPALARY